MFIRAIGCIIIITITAIVLVLIPLLVLPRAPSSSPFAPASAALAVVAVVGFRTNPLRDRFVTEHHAHDVDTSCIGSEHERAGGITRSREWICAAVEKFCHAPRVALYRRLVERGPAAAAACPASLTPWFAA